MNGTWRRIDNGWGSGIIRQKVLAETAEGFIVRRRVSKMADGRRYEKSFACFIPRARLVKSWINGRYGKYHYDGSEGTFPE
jgi:hypothetical protein